MEMNTYVESSSKQGTEAQLSDRFYHDCLKALGGMEEEAAMVLDDRGEVLFCNSNGAKILNSTPNMIAGKHISEFVLNMRLNAWTPGSNVAYATFTGRRNQWREYCILDSNRRGFPVELLLDVLVVNLRYLILLWVRQPVRQAGASESPNGRQLEAMNA